LLAVQRELQRSYPQEPAMGLLQARFHHAFLHARRDSPRVNHTVLACVWDRRRLLMAQVGDSSLLLLRNGHWELGVEPSKGEFANETTFLRRETPHEAISLRWMSSRGIDAVIGFSDGLEAAFLSPRPGSPSQSEPNHQLADLIFREHRHRCGWRGYRAWLRASLNDEVIRSLSDDDRTLVIGS
jgi:hypothetical protein